MSKTSTSIDIIVVILSLVACFVLYDEFIAFDNRLLNFGSYFLITTIVLGVRKILISKLENNSNKS